MELKITNNKHLNAAASTQTDAEKQKISKASREFESLMTNMMLKSMFETTEGGLLGKSESGSGADMFDGIFTQELSGSFSKGKGLGIAQQIYKSMTGEDLPSDQKVNDLKRNIYIHTQNKKENKSTPENLIEKRNKTDNEVLESVNAVEETKGISSPEIPTVKPSTSSLERVSKYDEIIDKAADKYGIDRNLVKSVILAESAGNNSAKSSAKAKGLMQLMDGTASDMGVHNVWDPKQNINGGTKYLSQLLRQYSGDVKQTLAAYNAGPGNVEKYNGIPPFKETKNYVNRVMAYINHFESKGNEDSIDN